MSNEVTRTLTKNKKWISAAVIGIILVVFFNPYSNNFVLSSLSWAGSEGATCEAYSVPNPTTNKNYPIIGGYDPDASKFPISTLNVVYDPDNANNGYPDFKIEVGNFWTEHERKEQIDYWRQNSDGTWQHISGFVESLYVNVVFQANPDNSDWPTWPTWSGTSEYENRWSSGTFWFQVSANVWELAYSDPAESQAGGRVWTAPLSAFVNSGQIPRDSEGRSSTYVYMIPEPYAGRQVQLFGAPNFVGGGDLDTTTANKDYSQPQGLDSTLQTSWIDISPSARLTPDAYFGFQPTNFGVQAWASGTITEPAKISHIDPKVEYTLKFYYLVIGEWIYTQYEYEDWILGDPQGRVYDPFWEVFGDWASGIINNPLTYLWTFMGIIVIFMVTLMVLAIFAPRIFYIFTRRGRRNEG